MRDEQPQLPHPRFQRVRAHHMVDPLGERDHLLHPSSGLRPGEVRAHAAAQIHGGADVEHFVGGTTKQIDAGQRGQVGGEKAFGALARGDVGEIVDEFGKTVHALVSDPPDQRVQHVDGGACVVERTVGGAGARTQDLREHAQAHRGRLVLAEHSARQFHGADHGRRGPRHRRGGGGRAQKSHVEACVVRDEDRTGGELEESGQYLIDGRRVVDHRGGDSGDLHDLRRDGAAGIHQGGELAEHFPSAHLHRADFGDRVGIRAGPGGFQVDNDESGVVEGRVEVIENQLLGDGLARHGN
ncbi:hypothetical protein GCM10023318_38150 [Nocardia callitridis]|uniref:Uncharacterized protein n=1 Tax=Nocardia callitridis TaxID=648753 RepID=A0ABP9KGS8_9NOCA